MRLHHKLSLRALPVTLLTLSAPFLLSTQAQARAFRVSQAPNNQWGCLLCHNGSGGPRNSFGGDVESTLSGGNVNWSAICDLDSDGDGFTNGQELGDPECLWSMGQANPPGPVTQPFNAQDVPQEPMGGEPMGGEPAGGVMGGEPAGGEPAGGVMGGEPAGGEPAGGEPAYTGEVSQPDEGCQSAPSRPSWLTLALLLGFFATRRRSA